MTPKKGIIGLLILIFLLSSVSLAVLFYDDQKDLSSRASGSMHISRSKILTNIKETSSSQWDGEKHGLSLSIDFDNRLWSEPVDSDLVFQHREQPITIRLVDQNLDITGIKKLLGADFENPKLISNLNLDIPNWRAQIYSIDFLGETKDVMVAGSDESAGVVVVYPQNTDLSEIKSFINKIKFKEAVKGASTPDESAQLATLVRPSVAMVLNRYCAEMRFLEAPGFALSGKQYPFCFVSVGTGFFVSKDGYLATNGHVVKNLPLSTIYYGVANGHLDTLLTDFLQVYLSQSTKTNLSREEVTNKVKASRSSKESTYQMAGLIAELFKKNYLKINNEKNEYYLQLGNNTAQVVDTGVNTTSDVVPATFIDSNYAEPDDKAGFVSSDVALLKASGNIFPALPLGSVDDALVGSNLQIVGFPGAAMSAKALVIDTSSNSEPTFTKGVVSAIKDAKGDNRKLIQTDATINHGNSGGPAITENGKVVGIATYGLTSTEGDGSYNFLRDIQDLRDLMIKNNVVDDPGDAYKLWQSGLNNYWLSYYKYAIKDLEKLKSIYPIHPMLDKYLADSRSKMGSVEDKTPRFTRQTRSSLIKVSGWSMSISLISVCGIFVYDFLGKKKKTSDLQEAPTF